MSDRIIDLSANPATLTSRGNLLVIKQGEPWEKKEARPRGAASHAPDAPAPEVTVPFDEIAALVAAHPAVSLTRGVAARMAAAGAILIFCDDNFSPAAMSLPVAANYVQTERFAAQAAAPIPVKKQLWKHIIVEKIKAQGRLLEEATGSDHGFPLLAAKVKSGDPDNIEARAAREYWEHIFGDIDFRRDRDGDPPNNLLNYGYAVIRAIIARAICAAGLHPALGLHHHNRYDSFPLASDLMEPFRTVVDRAVVSIVHERGADVELDGDVKSELLGALMQRYPHKGEQRSLFDIAARAANSLNSVFAGKKQKPELPAL